MAIRKKTATKKKAAAKKTVKKKASSKKPITKKKTPVRTAVQKELSGVEIAFDQSLQDQSLWGTESAKKEIDHFLPLSKVNELVRNFNKRKTPISKAAFMQPSNIKKDILLKLLQREDVASLRFYFGLNKHDRVQVIFVGADANHNDVYVKRIVPRKVQANTGAKTLAVAQSIGTTTENGGIDLAQGCPDYGSGGTVMLPQ